MPLLAKNFKYFLKTLGVVEKMGHLKKSQSTDLSAQTAKVKVVVSVF